MYVPQFKSAEKDMTRLKAADKSFLARYIKSMRQVR